MWDRLGVEGEGRDGTRWRKGKGGWRRVEGDKWRRKQERIRGG